MFQAGVRPAAVAFVAALACASGITARAQVAPLVFKEITGSTGIDYAGPSWSVAWSDVDGDALPDLFVGNHGALHNLFLNDGTGRFAEIAAWKFPREFSDAHGAAWADFDNDGDQDLLELVGADRGTGRKANRLYVNDGGVLRDQAASRGLEDPLGRGRRPVWFDWDRDGRLDALLLNAVRSDAPSALYRNDRGYFADTRAIGALGFTKYPLLGSFVTGKLHLVISGQPFPYRVHDANQLSPQPLPDLRTALRIPAQQSQVMDAALLDVNGDGRDDVLEFKGVLPSDVTLVGGRLLSHLKIDEVGGTRGLNFKASGALDVMVAPRADVWWNPQNVWIGSGGAHPKSIPFRVSPTDPAAWGLKTPVGDKGVYLGYDRASGKWRLRLVATNYQEANFEIKGNAIGGIETVNFTRFRPASRPTFLRSTTDGFVDASADAGLTALATTSNCFSVAAADFDNDGDVDVFAACSGPLAKQGVENQLYRNTGGGRFSLVSGAAGVTRVIPGVADGVAAADLDLDGFVDLALTNGQGLWPFNVGPTQVFRNASREAGNRHHWLQVDLRGIASNRDGVGARVTVTAGGRKTSRMQRNGVHNGAQDHVRLHFGLGGSTQVESLEVLWPSGQRQVVSGLPVDQVVRIVEGRAWSLPFALQPAAQAFGDVAVGAGQTRSFTLSNPRATSLPIGGIRRIGVAAAPFFVSHDCGSVLPAGASCSVRVSFRPTRPGPSAARLMVVAGDQVVRLADLSGRGV